MRNLSYLILFLVVEFSKPSYAGSFMKEKPDWLKLCDERSRDFEACLRRNTQELVARMAGGLPGFTAIKSFDPFEISRVDMDETQDPNNAVSFKLVIRDVLVHGLKDVIIKKCRVSNDTEWFLKLVFPKMKLEGKYTMDGRILTIGLVGDGNFILNLDTVQADIIGKVKIFEREGFKFYNVSTINANYDMRGLKIRLNNLFNGNVELGEVANDVLNDSWRDFAAAMKPTAIKVIEKIMLSVSRNVYDFLPINHFLKNTPEL